MCLNHLSKELQKIGYGYQLDQQTKISHLFYVDYLKLYRTNNSQLDGLLSTVKMVSDDTKMDLRLDYFANATFKRGKRVSTEGIHLPHRKLIKKV